MNRDKRKALIARQLARLYSSDGVSYDGPCACSGLSGACVHCSGWWSMFLDRFDRQRLEVMMDLYFECMNHAAKLSPTTTLVVMNDH